MNNPNYDDSEDDWYADKMIDLAYDAEEGKRLEKYEHIQAFPHDEYEGAPAVNPWKWLYETDPREYSLLWKEFFEGCEPYDRFIEPMISAVLIGS